MDFGSSISPLSTPVLKGRGGCEWWGERYGGSGIFLFAADEQISAIFSDLFFNFHPSQFGHSINRTIIILHDK